jgi:hypothetical protein
VLWVSRRARRVDAGVERGGREEAVARESRARVEVSSMFLVVLYFCCLEIAVRGVLVVACCATCAVW